ncbi:hypothetical protein M422DRAFT_230335 [Sphaerobolus stellatus SS14]|uniref:RlpA-like protein double-psi beta-barrel domain-containing protein n=1 Tax=Sphaerobolus stellatus (strain SS14) TaxID=990650 RepID=A0A0C9VPS0_SPHS4|nr:hypothetical protein M422DRAFT_230335 [Sphaerobolus stellatus SS14]
MQLTQVFVLVATVLASANALATPAHGVRLSHRHSGIAKARSPTPEVAISSQSVPKRSLKKRCKPRTTSSSLTIPSAVANVAAAPASSSVEVTPSSQEASPEPSPSPSAQASAQDPPTTQPPAPTTQAAPTTSSTPAPVPTTSATPAPAPTTSSSSLGNDVGTFTGQATWYDTGLTACGVTNTNTEYIAAVSELLFDTYPGYNGANPNNNPICGKQAQVTYEGKTITVTITDRCTACAMYDLDFTPTAFQNLADLGAGRISGISWHFI